MVRRQGSAFGALPGGQCRADLCPALSHRWVRRAGEGRASTLLLDRRSGRGGVGLLRPGRRRLGPGPRCALVAAHVEHQSRARRPTGRPRSASHHGRPRVALPRVCGDVHRRTGDQPARPGRRLGLSQAGGGAHPAGSRVPHRRRRRSAVQGRGRCRFGRGGTDPGCMGGPVPPGAARFGVRAWPR